MVAFGMPGGWEWIAILLVVLLLFGHRIPGMARALGSGITEFKRGLKDGGNEDKKAPPGSDQDPSKQGSKS
ncbi:MAG: twin-arginine translocase TatA/TatE family subunit [Planctomycetota bacterium]